VYAREMLIQMNEELEKEIIQKDDIIIQIKKQLETKNKRLDVFEEEL
jgi:hypothetical protein